MLIALTGGTGFLGRRIVHHLISAGHRLRCLVRPQTDVTRLATTGIELVRGELDAFDSLQALVHGADVVVHAAAWRGGGSFSDSGRQDPMAHLDKNVMGSLRLLELARGACRQFIFISSGAVYGNPPGNDVLTENFPRQPADAYGAYKAAVEDFCQAYAAQFDFNTCALRPVSILGLHEPPEQSPFFDLVRRVLAGETIEVSRGQKVVMVDDVGRSVALVTGRGDVKGEVYNLSGGYVRQQDVARLAAEASGSSARVVPIPQSQPQHQMSSDKIEGLGFRFGGSEEVENYVRQLIHVIRGER